MLDEVGMRSVMRAKEEYLYQQKRQMYAGKREDQRPIRPFERRYYPYHPRYMSFKRSLGYDVSRVTLSLHGDFQDQMYMVKRGASVFEISSRVDYQDFLEKWYRWTSPEGIKSIWGIGGPYKDKFLNELQPYYLYEFINEFL